MQISSQTGSFLLVEDSEVSGNILSDNFDLSQLGGAA